MTNSCCKDVASQVQASSLLIISNRFINFNSNSTTLKKHTHTVHGHQFHFQLQNPTTPEAKHLKRVMLLGIVY